MEVILMEEVAGLGDIGELVSVKNGYARNYLLPQRKAVSASVKNAQRLEHQKRIANFKMQKALASAQSLADKLKATSVTIARKTGENEKLFGSVTAIDIHKGLQDEGVEIDRRKIILDEPIKSLGTYQVVVKVLGELTAEIKVWVVAE
ncbi:50S ribosomal protein L9 [Myxococcota bacterium]|nr:50S ribosomal protein L9 [Myxococcota bacterium]